MADCNNNLFAEPLKPTDLPKLADLPESVERIRNIELTTPDELTKSNGLPDDSTEIDCLPTAADQPIEQPIDLPKATDLCYIRHVPYTGIDRTKTPILIQHGIFSNKESWAALGKRIADETKRAVYCLDARDHGESGWSEEFTFKALISDYYHFCQETGIEKAIFIGHSLGGFVYSRLATLFPNLVERLIIVDIHPDKRLSKPGEPNMVQMFAFALRKTLETLRKENIAELDKAKERLNELITRFIKEEENRKIYLNNLIFKDGVLSFRFNLDELIRFMDEMYQRWDIRPNYAGPTLEIHGSLSPFIVKDDYESLREMFPNIEIEEVEGGDHILHTTHPQVFLDKVLPFLNKSTDYAVVTIEKPFGSRLATSYQSNHPSD